MLIRARDGVAPGAQLTEVVERKGRGHPDSVCDGIAEHVCVWLCRYYLEHVGVILHHNVDKVLLCAGATRPAFGGGQVLEPIEIYLAGRATDEYGGTRIPVHDIAVDACRDWLRSRLRWVDVDHHVRITSRLRHGSADLTGVFARGAGSPLANDTSCGAGFAPFTQLERVVHAVERVFNSPETKQAHPEIGEDVKVMGVRRDDRIHLTIGCAFVDRFVSSLEDYAVKKMVAARLAVTAAHEVTAHPVEAIVNAADNLDRGDAYLTVTGTSAEAGDDGEVGRGNRVSGLITPYRAMTIEAAAGKNPVNHVGKLYNLAATRIADAICRELPDVGDASCVLVSRIGHRVDDPDVVDITIGTDTDLGSARLRVTDIVHAQLGDLDSLRDELLAERAPVF